MSEDINRDARPLATKGSQGVSLPESPKVTGATCDVKTMCNLYGITEVMASLLTNIVETGGNISKAAEMAGTTRQIHYDCLSRHEGYKKAWEHVRYALGNAAWLRLADRAVNGDEVIHNGKVAKDPKTGEPLRRFDTIAGIYVSKSGGGFADSKPEREKRENAVQISIHIPEANRTVEPIVVEYNQPQEEPERP